MRKTLILVLVAFVAFAVVGAAASNIVAPALSTNTVTVAEVKEHVSVWKALVAGIKEGGVGFIIANLLMVVLLVLGSARLVARLLEIVLGFIVKLTPGQDDDTWFKGKFLPVIATIVAWTTDVTGWLSLTFGRKGSDVIDSSKQ